MRFEVVELSPHANKLVLVGRLDTQGVGAIETGFTAAVSAAGRSAVLDLSGVEFMSSLGLRLLISNAQVVTRRGGRVVAFGAQPIVAEVFRAMALDPLLPLVGGEAEAVSRLAG
ncbi:MAG: STAS domain-containing protein [Acetobacteraceae bacterium]|nr:STAS domain-containing protein [Acetobacteraceae bacterium]